MKAAIIAVGVVILVLLVGGISSYVSYANSGVNYTETIDEQVAANKIKYSEFTSSAVEQMQVADKYKDALKDLITAAIEGRYGENGSTAVVQAMNEKYPGELDNTLFLSVQDTIKAGRIEFAQEQKMLAAKVKSYRIALRSQWSGMWLAYAGYSVSEPIDLSAPQYNPIINAATDESFKSGKDKGVKFN